MENVNFLNEKFHEHFWKNHKPSPTHCQLCWLDHEPPHQWGYNQPFSSLTANPKKYPFHLDFLWCFERHSQRFKNYFGWNFSTFVPVKVVERLLVRPQLLQPLVAVELVHDVLSACVVGVRAEERMYDVETLISSGQCWLTNLHHIINTISDKLYTHQSSVISY